MDPDPKPDSAPKDSADQPETSATANSVPASSVPASSVPRGERLVVERSGEILVEDLERAMNPVSRFFGLMGRASLAPDGGLWLAPCDSIHMMFMRFAIDVVWLNADRSVLKISSHVKPWIGMAWCTGAKVALELPSGRAVNLRIGDKLRSEF